VGVGTVIFGRFEKLRSAPMFVAMTFDLQTPSESDRILSLMMQDLQLVPHILAPTGLETARA
jgi:hypothetical protein